MEKITSRQNPLCTHLRKLASSASYRRQRGEFLCDSPKLLREALLWGAEIRTIVATEGVELPELPLGVRQVEVPADVMKSLSPMETPQGTLFVCAMRPAALPETLTGRRYVVLDTLQDPGNVGTILRTADAFHADGMFLVNGCADLYNPKTLRATMGAVFRCPVWTCGGGRAAGAAEAERHSPCTARPSGRIRWMRGRWITAAAPLPSAARGGACQRACWRSAIGRSGSL